MFFFNKTSVENWFQCGHCSFYSDVRRSVENHSKKSHHGRPADPNKIEVKTVGKYCQKFVRVILAKEDVHIQSKILLHLQVDSTDTRETRVMERNLPIDICLCFPAFRNWYLSAVRGLRSRGTVLNVRAELLHRAMIVQVGWCISQETGVYRGK
jgi:hypothetical protein